MRKIIVLALVALMAVSLIGGAEAKKRKKPKGPVSVDQKFYLRQDGDSCSAAHNFLSLTDGPDLACFLVFGGAVYTANEAVSDGSGGQVPVAVSGSETWAMEDSLPIVLDTTKHLTGELVVRGGEIQDPAPSASAGEAMFGMDITGEVAGEVKEIGTVEEDWTTSPGDKHVVKVDIAIDPAFAGVAFDSITLDTYMRGASIGPHTVELDNPAAYLIFPTIKSA